MSRIDDLINEFAPNGVPRRPLAELISYRQPGPFLVSSTNYDDAFATPVLTAGQTFLLGYTDEVEGIYPASPGHPVIIFDDFTTAFKWVDFPFKAKSSAMKLLTPADESVADLRYLYFVMQTILYAPQEHARQWIGTYSGFRVPVPPLEVQREIVRILDKFTDLEAELEAELEARRRQYAHHRSELLVNSENDSENSATLADVADFKRGTAITAKQTSPGNVPVVANGPAPTYTHSESNRSGETIVIARSGAYAGYVSYWNEPIFLTDAFSIHPNRELLRPKFLYYWLQSQQGSLHEMKKGAGVPHVRVKEVEARVLPLPALDLQDAIVETLDKFDALVNDLSIGLPAELAARRKQYEYYRDKLLTFEELV